MTTMAETRRVSIEDFRLWLADHGQDMDLTVSVEFVPESVRHDEGRVWLRVTRLVLNDEGRSFVTGPDDDTAEEVVWVPLEWLPGT